MLKRKTTKEWPARKKPPPARKPLPVRVAPRWLTTWRRLLHASTFRNLDELQAFLEELGVHNGEIPTKEAFRQGIAKSHRGKFFWNLMKCTRLLRLHGKCAPEPD